MEAAYFLLDRAVVSSSQSLVGRVMGRDILGLAYIVDVRCQGVSLNLTRFDSVGYNGRYRETTLVN